jgi:hypothetical protein
MVAQPPSHPTHAMPRTPSRSGPFHRHPGPLGHEEGRATQSDRCCSIAEKTPAASPVGPPAGVSETSPQPPPVPISREVMGWRIPSGETSPAGTFDSPGFVQETQGAQAVPTRTSAPPAPCSPCRTTPARHRSHAVSVTGPPRGNFIPTRVRRGCPCPVGEDPGISRMRPRPMGSPQAGRRSGHSAMPIGRQVPVRDPSAC